MHHFKYCSKARHVEYSSDQFVWLATCCQCVKTLSSTLIGIRIEMISSGDKIKPNQTKIARNMLEIVLPAT